MSYRMLYPVGFGHVVDSVKVLKAVEYFASYEDARKAVIDHRNKPDADKYSVVQLGYDTKAELMVYKPECASWTITNPCWTKQEFDALGKLCTLKIPVKTHKEQNMRMKWGWADAVVELFQTKFGVKFLDLQDWKLHYNQGTTSKTNHCLVYRCIVPESSMRALKESYGCTIVCS